MNVSPSMLRRAVAAISAATCLAIPWFVPTTPVLSESYALGFSNSAFFIGILLIFIVPVLLLSRFETEQVRQMVKRESDLKGTSVSVLAGASGLMRFGFYLYLIAASYLLLISSGLEGYAEAEYFIVRSKLVSIGLRPYVDFEYAYGSSMLYGLTGLAKLGLSNSFAEAVLVLVEALAGYLSLYAIIRSVFEHQRRAGQLTFAALLVATAAFLTSAGQNYTFFRFATPVLIGGVFLAISRRTDWLAPLLSGAVFTAAWLISPEISLAVTAAFVVIAIAHSRQKAVAVAAVLMSLAVAISLNSLVLQSFTTIFEFSRGGNNFPAFPSLHIVVLLTSIYSATTLVSRRSISDRNPIWFIYIASVGMLPGALGRCDPGHVTFYSFGFFVLASYRILVEKLYISAAPHIAYGIAMSIVSMLPWIYYPQVFGKAILIAGSNVWSAGVANKLIDLVPAPYQAKAKSWLASQAAGSNEPDFQHSGYSMLSVRSEVRDLKKFNFPYMLTMNNATTATSLVQLEKQLSDRKVLVPEHFFTDFCRPWKADYRIMSTLFLFPTKLFPQKNNPDIIKTSFCTMLNNMSPIEAKPEALPQGYKLFATP